MSKIIDLIHKKLDFSLILIVFGRDKTNEANNIIL